MELRRLRYFLGVTATGSLGKASRLLGVAQPALGRQIQLLEAELGLVLFRRLSKGMTLTREGEYLRDAIQHPLELIDTAVRNARSYATLVEASLVLGLPPVVAKTIGPRILRRLQTDLPNLRLRIVENASEKLAMDLSRAVVDVAILIEASPPEKVFSHDILTEALMLVASPGTELANHPALRFRDLKGLPLILSATQAGLRTKLAKAELSTGISLRIALEIDSIELAKQAAQDRLGYAILSPMSFRAEMEQGLLVGIPIQDPEIVQTVRWAVRPLWPVPRSTYDAVQTAVFEEWFLSVSSGAWPADWKLISTDGLKNSEMASLPLP